MRLAFFLVMLALAADAAAEAQCKLMRIAEWRVRGDYHRPVIDAAINGARVGVLLDTGASVSLIQRSVATRMRLPLAKVEGASVESALIQEFKVGKAVRDNLRMLVTDEHDFGDDVAVLIGDDFFQQTDVEFDLRNNAVRLYQPRDCAGAPLAYWTREALEVPIEAGERIRLAVAINGKPVRALLDSSAPRSLLAQAQAAGLGVTPQSPGAAAAGCARGFGPRLVDSWSAPFESFAIGAETIRNPTLRFADLGQEASDADKLPQMLLGADFLRSHRVLVSRSQGKIYFTYEGGTVFPGATPWGCNAPR